MYHIHFIARQDMHKVNQKVISQKEIQQQKENGYKIYVAALIENLTTNLFRILFLDSLVIEVRRETVIARPEANFILECSLLLIVTLTTKYNNFFTVRNKNTLNSS